MPVEKQKIFRLDICEAYSCISDCRSSLVILLVIVVVGVTRGEQNLSSNEISLHQLLSLRFHSRRVRLHSMEIKAVCLFFSSGRVRVLERLVKRVHRALQ